MAMIDYGAVVKKNGKIITKHMFQNYSECKYDYNDKNEEKIDETIFINSYGDSTSMAGNYFATIGDKKFLIGFYKMFFIVAINGKQETDVSHCFCEHTQKHVKPFYYTFNNGVKIVIRTLSINRKDNGNPYDYSWDWSICLAKFSYKNNNYEVLFGYGVDYNPLYCYGKKCCLNQTIKYWLSSDYKCIRKRSKYYINKRDRKLYRLIKSWFER